MERFCLTESFRMGEMTSDAPVNSLSLSKRSGERRCKSWSRWETSMLILHMRSFAYRVSYVDITVYGGYCHCPCRLHCINRHQCPQSFRTELFSRRRWATGSYQQSSMYGNLPDNGSKIDFRFVTNTIAYRLGQYSLHLFLRKSSMDYVIFVALIVLYKSPS